ncbi:MAG: 50S ribosomal protein L4 [Candidatus Margulisbacteria bacterium]|nr:50S ribosomal protein L4 [Candidatus Margulisiibacteriota bacterium]
MEKSKIFNEEKNTAVVHEVVRWLQASARRGTHSAKTRTEVSGGGKKPWKQKGTGRARAGSNRSPLWRKGGVIFPPKPRDYGYALPKKVRSLALRVALSEFNRESKLTVVDDYKLAAAKTKEGVKLLKELGVSGKVTVVHADQDDLAKSVRNIAGVTVARAIDVTVIDLLKSKWLVIDKRSVKILEERLS